MFAFNWEKDQIAIKRLIKGAKWSFYHPLNTQPPFLFIHSSPTHIPLASRSIQLQGNNPIRLDTSHLRDLIITLGSSVEPGLRRFIEETPRHFLSRILRHIMTTDSDIIRTAALKLLRVWFESSSASVRPVVANGKQGTHPAKPVKRIMDLPVSPR